MIQSKRLQTTRNYLSEYLKYRPLFLSLIRSAEAAFYHQYLPLKKPSLDVGCGDGFFAKTVFGSIDVGLDVSESRVLEAKGKQVYNNLVQYDGRVFPFGNQTFQTVVSNCVFEHIPDIKQTIAEIYRVLKPGGRLITTVMAKPWDDYLFGSLILGDWYRRYMRKKQVHLNLYSSSQWSTLFTQTGFKVIEEIGYLDRRASRIMDISHYISVPNLVSYVLTKKWVLWPSLTRLYPIPWLCRVMVREVNNEHAAGLFYLLEKRV